MVHWFLRVINQRSVTVTDSGQRDGCSMMRPRLEALFPVLDANAVTDSRGIVRLKMRLSEGDIDNCSASAIDCSTHPPHPWEEKGGLYCNTKLPQPINLIESTLSLSSQERGAGGEVIYTIANPSNAVKPRAFLSQRSAGYSRMKP